MKNLIRSFALALIIAVHPGSIVQAQSVRNVKGLCVIVDFANHRLENYQGNYQSEAIKSEAEIKEILNTMESHWAWMSLNTHFYEWDIHRITLDQRLGPNAFEGWWEYRDAVADKVKHVVNPADYDANRDGIMDTVFMIGSINDAEYSWAIGGRSINNGIDCFHDGQASQSIRVRAIGNFNHEAGHTRINGEQPDVYGDYDTLGYLTVMSNSWPTPAHGFSAFERCAMGWVSPQIITRTQRGILLRPAELHLEAIKIPTRNPAEYWLIEFRDKPESGFGSSQDYPDFRGLAIYHVNTNRQDGGNFQNPPFLRLEKPGKNPGYGTQPRKNDLWAPGNRDVTGPYVGRTESDPNQVYFTVENLSYTNDGMQFDVVIKESQTANSAYTLTPLYRFLRKDNNSHFFTASQSERDGIIANLPADLWALEGVCQNVLQTPDAGALPVYRLFNSFSGSHFYTMNEEEVDSVLFRLSDRFTLEGLAFYALPGPVQGALPVYRFFSLMTGSHFFTISEDEKDWIIANIKPSQLAYEGIAWWAFP